MEYAFAQGPVLTPWLRPWKPGPNPEEPEIDFYKTDLINVAGKLSNRTLKVFLRMKQNDISRRRNSGDLHA